MSLTDVVPNVPITSFKRVKIIATVGPSTDSYEAILDLIKAGANGIRLNFSHEKHDIATKHIKWIRQAAKEYGKPVAIIQDLQGPKVRLGDFDGVISVRKGAGLSFKYNADYEKTGHIPTQYDLSKKIKRGEQLYLYDGRVITTVTSVKDGVVHVRAENDGILIKRKGMNLPDTDFGGDIITAKDKADMAYGSTQDIDYVALSFVQSADDISNLRRMMKNLGFNAKVIAKIETKAAVENIESIIQETHSVMIARGDLAVETPAESVPIVQRKIIGLGLKYGKPTIVATQMMASMTEAPEPTRAEVSDVATAVLVGADCVMLSDETASGKYPIEAVKIMKTVIKYSEANSPLKAVFPANESQDTQAAIPKSVVHLAETVKAKAIVVETKSGATALHLAALRSDIPLIVVTDEIRTAQQLSVVYGAKSYVRPAHKEAAMRLTDWLLKEKVLKKGDMVVTASGRYPGVVGTTDTIKVRMLE
jgi:pyruvate kinase